MPPRLLTPLQLEATQLFFSLPQSAGFAVAGGAALIVQGLIQRQTRDVDLFLLDAAASTITSAAASFETAIGERGWSHQRVIDQSDFVRLLITGSRKSLIVALGRDSPAEEPVDATDLGPTLSLRDLAARKTLALFGRAEARDFADVYDLAHRFGPMTCTFGRDGGIRTRGLLLPNQLHPVARRSPTSPSGPFIWGNAAGRRLT